jgi:hypothetical protein
MRETPRRKYKSGGTTCKYSDSCFTCPLPDCRADAKRIATINLLPGETINRVTGNKRRRSND